MPFFAGLPSRARRPSSFAGPALPAVGVLPSTRRQVSTDAAAWGAFGAPRRARVAASLRLTDAALRGRARGPGRLRQWEKTCSSADAALPWHRRGTDMALTWH